MNTLPRGAKVIVAAIGFVLLLPVLFLLGRMAEQGSMIGGQDPVFGLPFTDSDVESTTMSARPEMAPAMAMGRSAMGGMVGNGMATDKMMIMPAPTPSDAATTERKLSVSYSLSLDVKDINKTLESIAWEVKQMTGYVEGQTTDTPREGEKSAWITVRVPEARADEALAKFRGMASVVRSVTQGSVDLTAPIMDTEVRLKNLLASETEMRNLLSRATKIDDILQIQSQLTQMRSEIESLQGQTRYYGQQTNYTMFTISLTEEPAVLIDRGTLQPVSIWKSAVNTLISMGNVILSGLIYFVVVAIPLLAVYGLILYVVFIAVRAVVRRVFRRF